MNKNVLDELLEKFYETPECTAILDECMRDLSKNKGKDYDEETVLEAIARSFEWAVKEICRQGGAQ